MPAGNSGSILKEDDVQHFSRLFRPDLVFPTYAGAMHSAKRGKVGSTGFYFNERREQFAAH
jgi:hypothetical protein